MQKFYWELNNGCFITKLHKPYTDNLVWCCEVFEAARTTYKRFYLPEAVISHYQQTAIVQLFTYVNIMKTIQMICIARLVDMDKKNKQYDKTACLW